MLKKPGVPKGMDTFASPPLFFSCFAFMQFRGEKSEALLHLGRRNQMHRYRIGGTWFNSSNCERDLGALLDNHLSMSQKSQCSSKLRQQRVSLNVIRPCDLCETTLGIEFWLTTIEKKRDSGKCAEKCNK